jgi:hypothetical protein
MLVVLHFVQLFIVSCPVFKQGYNVHTLENGTKVIVGTLTWQEWGKSSGWQLFSSGDYFPDPDLTEEITLYKRGKAAHIKT